MASLTKHQLYIIQNIWCCLAFHPDKYWSSEGLALAEGLFQRYVKGSHNAAALRAAMEKTRIDVSKELGLPPWEG